MAMTFHKYFVAMIFVCAGLMAINLQIFNGCIHSNDLKKTINGCELILWPCFAGFIKYNGHAFNIWF